VYVITCCPHTDRILPKLLTSRTRLIRVVLRVHVPKFQTHRIREYLVFCYQYTYMSASRINILNFFTLMPKICLFCCVNIVVWLLFREHYNGMLTEHICVSAGWGARAICCYVFVITTQVQYNSSLGQAGVTTNVKSTPVKCIHVLSLVKVTPRCTAVWKAPVVIAHCIFMHEVGPDV
jgi:hypothetical protein